MAAVKTLQDPKVQYPLPLVHKEPVSHDTRLFRFGLPSEHHVLGLPVGQHIHFTATIDGNTVVRKYSPVTSDKQKGHVDLVIKVYEKGSNPEFPAGGKMSQYVDGLQLGQTMDVRGPAGRLVYCRPGVFAIRKNKKDPSTEVQHSVSKVNMIAGGSGIAPMLQIIRQMTEDPDDVTQIRLLFANRTEEDILMRGELDELAGRHPDQLTVWYTVDRAGDAGWRYSTGYITADMMRAQLFPPGPDTMVLVCGPDPMLDLACRPNLEKLKYDPTLQFIYQN